MAEYEGYSKFKPVFDALRDLELSTRSSRQMENNLGFGNDVEYVLGECAKTRSKALNLQPSQPNSRDSQSPKSLDARYCLSRNPDMHKPNTTERSLSSGNNDKYPLGACANTRSESSDSDSAESDSPDSPSTKSDSSDSICNLLASFRKSESSKLDITERNLSLEKDLEIGAYAYSISDTDLVSALLYTGTESKSASYFVNSKVKRSIILSAFATVKDNHGNPYIKPMEYDMPQFLEEAKMQGYVDEEMPAHKNKESRKEIWFGFLSDKVTPLQHKNYMTQLLEEARKQRYFVDEEMPLNRWSSGKGTPLNAQAVSSCKSGNSEKVRASSGATNGTNKVVTDTSNSRTGRFLSSLVYLLFESARYSTKNYDEKSKAILRRRVQRGLEFALPVSSHLGDEKVAEFISHMSGAFLYESPCMRAFVYIYCRAYDENNRKLLKQLEAAAGYTFIHYKHTAVKYITDVFRLSGIDVASTLATLLKSIPGLEPFFNADLTHLKKYSEWCETPTAKKDKLFRKMASLVFVEYPSLLSKKNSPQLCGFLQFVMQHLRHHT